MVVVFEFLTQCFDNLEILGPRYLANGLTHLTVAVPVTQMVLKYPSISIKVVNADVRPICAEHAHMANIITLDLVHNQTDSHLAFLVCHWTVLLYEFIVLSAIGHNKPRKTKTVELV
jgi:hypothetical protein